MSLVNELKFHVAKALTNRWYLSIEPDQVLLNLTKPEFEGDYTVVLFGLSKQLKMSPDQLGEELGRELANSSDDLISGFNVIKGFLNLNVSDKWLISYVAQNGSKNTIELKTDRPSNLIVEYSSPNTNKPLHLGHLRNNFLGWSLAEILKATGNKVFKTCIVNDRGIHICKSMIAWQQLANGATPESVNQKGDHFVGEYYVKFENELRSQAATLSESVLSKDYSSIADKDRQRLIEIQEMISAIPTDSDKDKDRLKKMNEERMEIVRANTPIMKSAQKMLYDWEQGDAGVIDLWKQMNSWVYKGFAETYTRIGSDFDRTYYESETYLLGKEFVEDGLRSGVLYRRDDSSVWIDLKKEGLDEKLLLRKDGTSVYMTQDLGLAEEKYQDFPYERSYYVIADEQNHHMKVLKAILKKLNKPYADGIAHMSYGMVDLPTGRMKSREGTVVDADDLVNLMVQEAEIKTKEKSKVEEFTEDELRALYEVIALGALKFFLLKVDPKKRMVFDPKESIDFHGFTGPFIQYTHARLRSILRRPDSYTRGYQSAEPLLKLERDLILSLEQYNETVHQAAAEQSPSVIANYIYSVAQTFNTFYTQHQVLKAESEDKRQLRLNLCEITAATIKHGMHLLGIKVPEKM